MSKEAIYTAAIEQRHRLADVLDGLREDEWNTASLCTGWRVRDVVGHLLSILEVPTGRFLFNALKARSFDTYADQVARAFGDRDPQALRTAYRAAADRRVAPPIIGPIAPLTDVLVHTRDIERPLGLPSQLDPEALCIALDFVCSRRARGFIPTERARGLRFEASDLDWSVGSGPVISGTGEAILLALTDRRAALADLSGDGAPVLADRLAEGA